MAELPDAKVRLQRARAGAQRCVCAAAWVVGSRFRWFPFMEDGGGDKGFPGDFSAIKLLFLFHGWSLGRPALVQKQGAIREIGAERQSPFCQIPAGDSGLGSLNWGAGTWITFIQEILNCGGFSYVSQPLSIVLLPSPPSLGILALGECWGFLKLNPFVLVGVRGPRLMFIGTISALVRKTPRSAGLDPCSPGLSLPHLSVSAAVIS